VILSREQYKELTDRIKELEADIKEAMEWNWLDENFEAWPDAMTKLADKYWEQSDE